MKIEKLPSGSYRFRKTYKGKTYTVIVPYKPTQKEAMQLLVQKMSSAVKVDRHLTIESASLDYVESKSNVLSGNTIGTYLGYVNSYPEDFRELPLSDLTSVDVQKEVNRYAKGHSAKTTANYHGFIHSVLLMYRPDLRLVTTLPARERFRPHVPTDAEVKAILDYFTGTKYEAALKLCVYGLRRSEICALDIRTDLHDSRLDVNKSKVRGSDGVYYIRPTPKTDASNRSVRIDDQLAQLLVDRAGSDGSVLDGSPDTIYLAMLRAQRKLGLPHFRLHDLRHYYASMAHAAGVPDAYIMKSGGWNTDSVMKRVYRDTIDDRTEQMEQLAIDHISSLM